MMKGGFLNKYIFFLCIASNGVYAQNASVIHLKGSVYDERSGYDLPSKVYSVKNGTKKLLAEPRKNGIFYEYNAQVPVGTDSLIFESAGYYTKSFPLYFYGKFKQGLQNHLTIETLKLDRPEVNRRYIIFCAPEKSNNNYNVIHHIGNEWHCTINKTFLKSNNSLDQDSQSRYVIQILSQDNELLSEVEYRPLSGINIVDLTPYVQENNTNDITGKTPVTDTISAVYPASLSETPEFQEPGNNEATEAPEFQKSGSSEIFFEQSKYELTATAQESLEEIVNYLNRNPEQKIKIKGFTDGVGEGKLNETLAKYRAQGVTRYLINKGLSPDRIKVEWQKSGEQTLIQKEELDQYRKVTITGI